MSIVSGQDTRVQIGLSPTWRTVKKAKYCLPYTNEGFKGTPNYKSMDALVGAKTKIRQSIMSFKADGSYKTYLTMDLFKILIYCALGRELARTTEGGQQVHTYVPIPSGLCRVFPGLTVEIDRIFEKALYYNYKTDNWKLSGAAEDYVYFESDGPAFAENLQTVLLSSEVVDFASATKKITLQGGLISADDQYNGKVVRVYSGCTEYKFIITDTALATNDITVDTYPTTGGVLPADDALNGYMAEILDWDMTPGISISQLEALRFSHARLYIEGASAEYKVKGSTRRGKATETVGGLPSTVDCKAVLLTVEALNSRGEPCVYQLKAQGTAKTPTSGVLTFNDTASTAAQIPSIIKADGSFNSAEWTLVTELYDEVNNFTLSGGNGHTQPKYGANGSLYPSEPTPQGRTFSLEATLDFTKRYSDLRKRKLLAGAPAKLQLIFLSTVEDIDGSVNTSVDSTGNPYKVVVNLPLCYHVDGIPNIGGADIPSVTAKFDVCEDIANGVEAIEVKVYDDVSADIYGEEVARIDGN
jgi:hypothetical protein